MFSPKGGKRGYPLRLFCSVTPCRDFGAAGVPPIRVDPGGGSGTVLDISGLPGFVPTALGPLVVVSCPFAGGVAFGKAAVVAVEAVDADCLGCRTPGLTVFCGTCGACAITLPGRNGAAGGFACCLNFVKEPVFARLKIA